MQKRITQPLSLKSAIYTGLVKHVRIKNSETKSKAHDFSYRVFMMYIDLDELEQVFTQSFFWSYKKIALARFKQEDYFFDKEKGSIKETVKGFIKQETNNDFEGRVCLLTNLRYFGFIINPISCYYCFDENDQLKYVVAEVTNTPWKEVKRYLLPVDLVDKKYARAFAKNLHVSPFMPMEMLYYWRGNLPEKTIHINLQCHNEAAMVVLESNELRSIASEMNSGELITSKNLVFTATLNLRAQKISTYALNRLLIQYPLMTLQVFIGIHWQALKLLVKKIPIVKHPKGKEDINES